MSKELDSVNGAKMSNTNNDPKIENVSELQNDSPIKIEPEEMEDSQETLNDPAFEPDNEEDDLFQEEEGSVGSYNKFPDRINSTCSITQISATTTVKNTEISATTTVKNTEISATTTLKNKDEEKEVKVADIRCTDTEKTKMNYMWVCNITKTTKACDLKKYFSQIGKVLTAKILTNGKSFYGYVSVENSDIAALCIKRLNNSLLDGNTILVSKNRPDLKENKVKRENPNKRTNKSDRKDEKNLSLSDAQETTSEIKIVEERNKQAIDNLNRKLREAYVDIARYKRKFEESQRRYESIRRKCESFEKQLANLQMENRIERRKLNREREEFDKTKKLEEIRFEADRAVVNRELTEVRKLRLHLKEKIDEFKNSTAKISKRARSPVLRNVRSPLHQISQEQTRFTHEERAVKRSKKDDIPRGRSPPPPNTKVVETPKKRANENHSGNRHYLAQIEKKYMPTHPFDYRLNVAPPVESARTNVQVMYPKDMRRSNPFQFSSNSYNESRYGGGFQHQPNNVPLTPRTAQTHYYTSY